MATQATKRKRVDRAVPTSRKPTRTDAQRIASTRAITTTMKGSPLWAAHPSIQAAATAWIVTADAVEATATVVADLMGKLQLAQAAQRVNRRNWDDARKHVFSTVAVATQGSIDDVLQLGLDVRPHRGLRLPMLAPTGLIASPSGVAGQVNLRWAPGGGRHGFMVQRATDPADHATYSLPVASTRARFKLAGLGSGAVYVRVSAIDPASPSGQSPYSDWVIASWVSG